MPKAIPLFGTFGNFSVFKTVLPEINDLLAILS